MIAKGEEYSRRLASFSDSTMRLLAELTGFEKEVVLKSSEISANMDYDEAEVVRRLEELKQSALMKKEMK